MSFVTEKYLAFVLILLIVYYVSPKKWQPYILLAAGYVFYGFSGIKNFVYILFTTLTTYFGAIILARYHAKRQEQMQQNDSWSRDEKKKFKQQTNNRKRLICACVLLLNFGVLAYVKYFSYLVGVINSVFEGAGRGEVFPLFYIALPLGISFFTFQALSYVIDVSHNKYPPQKNIFKYALFVAFFPQLVQGPIGRYDELAPQLYAEHRFDIHVIKRGFLLMLWGYVKKTIIADNLATFVTPLFAAGESLRGMQVFLAGLFYGLQIYCDFSGGIDISRGTAEMLGIEMALNFTQPFFANSMSDFWRRWHITLGGWMRDYVFYPLALSKFFSNIGKWAKKHISPTVGKVLPTCLIACVNFLLIGIWHGPNFKYIVYGLFNGVIIGVGILTEPIFAKLYGKLNIDRDKSRVYRVLQVIRTIIFVTVGRIIGHADTWADGKVMLANMFSNRSGGMSWAEWMMSGELGRSKILIIIAGLVIVFARDALAELGVDLRDRFDRLNVYLQALIIDFAIMAVFLFGVYGLVFSSSSFLYGGY